MDSYHTLHEILVKLFNDIMDIEEKAIITEEFKDISNKDMHIIEAIGIEIPKNMSTVAKSLSVTVGTLTIAINSLVKKNYVNRVRSEEDRRVVLISLSKKGKHAFEHHKRFHNEMIKATLDGLDKEQTEILVKALSNLKGFFHRFS
ncbi:MarR family transcriptional regulator [Lachnospiraceae bacterium ZAX-1]